MTRRAWLLAAVGLYGCRSREGPANVLAETVAGWHRTSLSELSASAPPDPVPATSIRHAERALYEGSGNLDVRVYELTRPELALDLVQRLRAPADAAYFYFDHVYFVAIHWRQGDLVAMQNFVRRAETRREIILRV
ncbi:MAG TPA: hypothetical protein VK419_15665 [Bryobacteraceae bacterium]|nr:hypothetical protein [Bryobacteraceae bacterium]